MDKEQLTNELFRKKFQSQFDLVRYAIRLAENKIRSGRDARVDIDIENPAMEILAEIAEGKDQFDDIVETIPQYKEEQQGTPERFRYNGKESASEHPKHSERKKSRSLS